jgi:hypothetical protein
VNDLDGRLVEFQIRRGKRLIEGNGSFWAIDLGGGWAWIAILKKRMPGEQSEGELPLTQAEANAIASNPRFEGWFYCRPFKLPARSSCPKG